MYVFTKQHLDVLRLLTHPCNIANTNTTAQTLSNPKLPCIVGLNTYTPKIFPTVKANALFLKILTFETF